MAKIIKKSLLYFFILFIILFFNPYISAVLSLLFALASPGINETVYVNLMNGLLGTASEVVFVLAVMYPFMRDDRKINFKEEMLSFGIALVLQFIASVLIYFYPWIAGMGVTYISRFCCVLVTGDMPTDPTPKGVPIYYYIVFTVLADILRVCAFGLAFAMAKMKHKKEKEDILGR